MVAALLLPLQPDSEADDVAALRSAVTSDDAARVLITALAEALAAYGNSAQAQGKLDM